MVIYIITSYDNLLSSCVAYKSTPKIRATYGTLQSHYVKMVSSKEKEKEKVQ